MESSRDHDERRVFLGRVPLGFDRAHRPQGFPIDCQSGALNTPSNARRMPGRRHAGLDSAMKDDPQSQGELV